MKKKLPQAVAGTLPGMEAPPPARRLLCWLLTGCLLLTPLSSSLADTPRTKPITLVTGPEAADLLRTLGEPLQRAAGLQGGEIHFHVMLDNSLNAMALPGQHIIFNSGLLLAVQERNELAAVMAHEIAHLSAGHHIQLESTLKEMAVQTMVAFAAGLAAGIATGNAQVAQAAITGGTAASRSGLLESMREKETQADRLAIRYLLQAGFDPQGMVRFMERINREQRISNVPPPYLLTHPLSAQRLTESQQQIEALSTSTPPGTQPRGPLAKASRSGSAAPSPADEAAENALLARVQAVLEASGSDDIHGLIGRLRQRLSREPDHFPSRYGLAVAERYMGQLSEASRDLEALLKRHPQDPYLLRERGMVRLEQGNPAAAEQDFRAALRHQSRQTNADLQYRLAFSLQEQEKWGEASQILRPLTLENPLIAEYFHLLGVVEGKQGHLGASHLALARHFYLTLEKKMARWHYKEAIRLFDNGDTGKNIARDELALLEQLDKSSGRRGPFQEP
ncbi:MAG: M48 family metalloprotease [Magnetococcales bacterium]|nr:M48 family metalloprotease [Magnetococcales bacterium]